MYRQLNALDAIARSDNTKVAVKLKGQMVLILPVQFVTTVAVTVFLGLPTWREFLAATAASVTFMLGTFALFTFASPYMGVWSLLAGCFVLFYFSRLVYRRFRSL